MKKHIATLILLLLALLAFTMRFFARDSFKDYCDILAFFLPTIAAVVEIYLSEKNGKVTEEMIKKLKEKQISVRIKDETLVIEEGID